MWENWIPPLLEGAETAGPLRHDHRIFLISKEEDARVLEQALLLHCPNHRNHLSIWSKKEKTPGSKNQTHQGRPGNLYIQQALHGDVWGKLL